MKMKVAFNESNEGFRTSFEEIAIGRDGEDGLSAYQIALNNGFVGTEEAWLQSLHGRDGVDGKEGYTPVKGVDYFDGNDGKDGYTPIKGVDYFDGKNGLDGKDGNDGYTPQKGVDYWTEQDISEMNIYVSEHNTSTEAHNDIRLLIEGLTTRLNTLADSDDITLDQMSELVAYIKSNRELIESVTTDKVNVNDIIDNLTTNVSNKPLSASQGVAIKVLIDTLDLKKVDTSSLESEVKGLLASETWTFTLEDGSEVQKVVYVG